MNQRPGGDGLARQETGIGRIDPPCLENPMRRQQQCLTFKRESWKSLPESIGTSRSCAAIPTFPPPRERLLGCLASTNLSGTSNCRPSARLSRIQIPKRQNPLRLPFASFRLILGLEKTPIVNSRWPGNVSSALPSFSRNQ
jgi:hypothetical protein